MTSLALALANVLYVAYWLPESLPVSPPQSNALRWSIPQFYQSLKSFSATVASPITMLAPERSGREPYMMILGIAIFLFALDAGSGLLIYVQPPYQVRCPLFERLAVR